MNRRLYLPTVADRRDVLRALAASLLCASCGVSPTSSSSEPDAGSSGMPDAAGGGGPAGTSMCGTSLCLDLTNPANASLVNPGGARLLSFAGKALIIGRVSASEVVALSSICTHQGCTVQFATSRFSCPCHGSLFGLDGSVQRGPALRPLMSYPTTYDPTSNVVTIAL